MYEVWTTHSKAFGKGWKRIHTMTDIEQAKRTAISWVYEFNARAAEVREVKEDGKSEQIFFFSR